METVSISADDFVEKVSATGRKFYYNRKTEVSSWTKPIEHMSDLEKKLQTCDWKEYFNSSMHPFYHNVISDETTWIVPDEILNIFNMNLNDYLFYIFEKYRKPMLLKTLTKNSSTTDGNKKNSSNLIDSIINETKDMKVSSSKSSTSNPETRKYADCYDNMDDAREAFKQMLIEYNIGSNMTYDSAMKIVIEDSRFNALKFNQERKQAFNAYKQFKIKEERDLERKAERLNEEKLYKFIIAHKDINLKTRFSEAQKLFQSEAFWLRVPSFHRRDVFDDAIRKMERMASERERERRQKIQEYITEVIASDCGVVIGETTYSDVKKALAKIDDDTVKDALERDKLEILIAYEKYTEKLYRSFTEKVKKEKKNVYRQSRKNRNQFWSLLGKLTKSGKIDKHSKWKDFYPLIKNDELFISICLQKGSTPLDIFKLHCYRLRLKEDLEKKKKLLSNKENIEFQEHLKSMDIEKMIDSKFDELYANWTHIDKDDAYCIFKMIRKRAKHKYSKLEKQSSRGDSHNRKRKSKSKREHNESPDTNKEHSESTDIKKSDTRTKRETRTTHESSDDRHGNRRGSDSEADNSEGDSRRKESRKRNRSPSV